MKNKNGFTIIEVIIFIVIASVGFLILSATYTSVLEYNATGENLSVATSLCEGKMEEVLDTHSFDTIANVAQTAFASPFGSYTYQVAWIYVNPTNLQVDAGTPTDYKIVDVIVDHGCIEPVQLTTLMVNY
jgi:type II secretory pathway pseudopilin PulG